MLWCSDVHGSRRGRTLYDRIAEDVHTGRGHGIVRSDVDSFLKRCVQCFQKLRAPDRVVERPSLPKRVFERMQIDLFRPNEPDRGKTRAGMAMAY